MSVKTWQDPKVGEPEWYYTGAERCRLAVFSRLKNVRLKQIKLSGFKSFVDPTSFDVPSQLVGVVGPNGCGKSNIMDALRWVLGESRASELRGESMQDVIFNGSEQRKPASRASVELVFDNSSGRIGGSWGSFAELSVRRILTRDGQSTYSINHQVVRRKDVHDIFLGTGLGPRAYAIIGQGTISRIIEARPEDLRIFLEEAAGVSKYKERRRETENRLSDTRDNLTRVDDIVRELTSQISKLERQAEVAQRYRDYDSEKTRKQQMLWLLKRDDAAADRDRLQVQVATVQTELESTQTSLRSLETELEALRESQFTVADALHGRQASYYEASSAVARIEAEIRMVVDSRDQMTAQMALLTAQTVEAQARQTVAHEQSATLVDEIEEAAGREEHLLGHAEQLAAKLEPAHAALAKSLSALESSRTVAGDVSKEIEVIAARQSAARRQIENLTIRQERLQAERKQIQRPDQDQLDLVRGQREELTAREDESLGSMNTAESQWRGLDAQRAPAQESLQQHQSKLAQIDARMAALKQLQDRVQAQSKVGPWLEKHGLDKLGRLWQKIQIEKGWETAVESLLRDRVAALEVGSLDLVTHFGSDTPPGKTAFYTEHDGAQAEAIGSDFAGAIPIAGMVRSANNRLSGVLSDWLANIYCAQSLAEAMHSLKNLSAQRARGISFVTKEGHVVTKSGVQFYATDGESEGILARQNELESLTREHRAQQMLADEQRARVVAIESAVVATLASFTAQRERHASDLRGLGQVRLEAERLEQSAARSDETFGRINAQLEETQGELEALLEEEAVMAERFESQDMALAERQNDLETRREEHAAAVALVDRARQEIRDAERQQQELSFQRRSLQTRAEQLKESARLAIDLIARTGAQMAGLTQQLAALGATANDAGLQSALEARVAAEKDLALARDSVEAANQKMRQFEEKKLGIERGQEPLRLRLNDCQLKEQAARLNIEQYQVQLDDVQCDEAVVRAAFEVPPKQGFLQGELTRLSAQIENLGPVNLAALDELTQSKERETFLVAQLADLNEAINTLEDAIRKIDRETREMLQTTFDNVNVQFGVLFPKLFGGGEARLVLTGDEILNSGVQVMAQPPGKRNATIHLLSGGEKALTAIALVFAMFHLNPAPFCLLDEVDAPLDDANTERYCNIVREMSVHTQFLFITHNKIAMEIAQQLIGVTMQEKGVSRIVAVDLEVAARMLEAA